SPTLDGHVKNWDLLSGQEQRDLATERGIVAVAADPSGKRITAGTFVGWIHTLDLATGQEGPKIDVNSPRNRCEVFCLAYHPNGRILAMGSWAWEKALRLFDPDTGKELRILAGHAGNVYSVTFTPDGRSLITSSSDATVR